MFDGLVAVALGAGLLAAVNPCGFALLPAYVSLLIGRDDDLTRGAAVGRALTLTGAMTLGFAGVFAVFGLAIAPVAAQVQQHLPWFTVVLGVALALMGVWMLAGRVVKIPAMRRPGRPGRPPRARPITRSFWSMTGFGASYAVASLSCTIAPFLAVVIGGFRSGSPLEGIVLFLAYATGMGLVVGTLAIATALASSGTVSGLRKAGRWTPRIAGALLAVSGAYVAYYGAWELRVNAGANPADPIIDAAARVQQFLVDIVAAVGPGGWALIAGALLVGVLTLRRTHRSGAGPRSSVNPAPSADTVDTADTVDAADTKSTTQGV